MGSIGVLYTIHQITSKQFVGQYIYENSQMFLVRQIVSTINILTIKSLKSLVSGIVTISCACAINSAFEAHSYTFAFSTPAPTWHSSSSGHGYIVHRGLHCSRQVYLHTGEEGIWLYDVLTGPQQCPPRNATLLMMLL